MMFEEDYLITKDCRMTGVNDRAHEHRFAAMLLVRQQIGGE